MPLLYNIAKLNNTVVIQCSVYVYTEVYSILSFSITEGATRPVSSDVKTLCPFLEPRGGRQWLPCTCSLLRLAQWLSVSVNTDGGRHLLL